MITALDTVDALAGALVSGVTALEMVEAADADGPLDLAGARSALSHALDELDLASTAAEALALSEHPHDRLTPSQALELVQ